MGYSDDAASTSSEGCCFKLLPATEKSRDVQKGGSVGELGNNNNEFQLSGVAEKHTFPKKARIDLSFEDVRYSVREWTLKHPIPGEFNRLSERSEIGNFFFRLSGCLSVPV